MQSIPMLVQSTGSSRIEDRSLSGATLRYAELDLLRGAAVIAMITYHAYIISIWVGTNRAGWSPEDLGWLQRPIPILFIVVSGISFSILSRRASASVHPYRLLLRPVGRVALAAALVSIASCFIVPDGFVRFGILHLIAASWLLAPAIRWNRVAMAIIATIILSAKAILGTPQVWSAWWAWAGFPYPGFATIDYFPLFPWFGVFLFGVLIGDLVYRDSGRLVWLSGVDEYVSWRPCRLLALAGRHALTIYLSHLPLIYCLARGWVWLTQ